MNRYIKTLLFAILVASIMVGCSTPKELLYKDFNSLALDKVDLGSTSIKMNLVYYNPNNFGLQLKRTDLDIYIDGTLLGHTSQDYQITIPRQSDFTLPISVAVDMKNIFTNAFNTLFSKEVTVKITGRIKLGKANVFFGMPVNYEGKQQLSPLF